MVEKRRASFWFGLALVAVCAFIWFDTSSYPAHLLDARKITGPGTFPRILSAILGAAGLYEIICSFLQRKIKNETPTSDVWSWGNQNIVLIVLLTIIYVPLIKYIGFAFATVAYSAALMMRLKAKPMASIVVSALTVALIIAIFDGVFRVQFPAGILTEPLKWRF